jgi:hypothetical protein
MEAPACRALAAGRQGAQAVSPEEVVALERRVYVIPRDLGNGEAELFVQAGRDKLVVPLGPLTIIQLAEFCDAWRTRLLRRAFVEKGDG